MRLRDTGTIEIDDQKFQLNQEFINDTIILAEDLNLDEIIAAKFLQQGALLSDQYDRSVLESAYYVFHKRRTYILECLKLIISYAFDSAMEGQAQSLLSEFLKNICKSADPKRPGFEFSGNCISEDVNIQERLKELNEKENRFRYHNNAQALEIVHVRRDFYLQEHMCLVQILSYLIKKGQVGWREMKNIFDVLKTKEKVSTYECYMIMPCIVFLFAVCGNSTDQKFTHTDIHLLQREVVQFSSTFTLKSLGASFTLCWLSALSGICKVDDSLQASLNYSQDIHKNAQIAIDNGAFTFMIDMMLEYSAFSQEYDKSKEEYLQPFDSRISTLDGHLKAPEGFLFMLYDIFQIFVCSFISNMADILKEMKVNEEDAMMAQSMSESVMDSTENNMSVTFALEKFFVLISILYDSRVEACESFWLDQDSDQFGFLLWASMCSTPGMVASYCDMLASLCSGVKCGLQAYTFLLDDEDGGSSKGRKKYGISWDYIFESLKYYSEQLKSPVATRTATLNAPTALAREADIPEIDFESAKVLNSYLRLLKKVLHTSGKAKHDIYHNESYQILKTLFNLLHCKVPSPLVASLLKTIAAFSTINTSGAQYFIWGMLDDWVFGNMINGNPTFAPSAVSRRSITIQSTILENIAQSFEETAAFLEVLSSLVRLENVSEFKLNFPENLGATYRQPGIHSYIEFCCNTVFTNLNATLLPSPKLRYVLQIECLQTFLNSFESFRPELIANNKITGLNFEKAVQCSSIESYIQLHPACQILLSMTEPSVISILFEILKTEVTLGELDNGDSTLVCSLIGKALKVLDWLLTLQELFFDIMLPILKESSAFNKEKGSAPSTWFEDALVYHMSVVCQIAFFVGIPNTSIAFSAVTLLSKIRDITQFQHSNNEQGTGKLRQTRLSDLLSTSEESRQIQFGFIQQLEADSTSTDEQAQVNQAIYSFINETLISLPTVANVAHFLLGFTINPEGSLSLGSERGEIMSGVSLLHTILGITAAANVSDDTLISDDMATTVQACFQILANLSLSSMTSNLLMDIFSESSFLEDQIRREDFNVQQSLLTRGNPEEDESVTTQSSFDRCKNLMQIVALQLRWLSKRGSVTAVAGYVQILTGLETVSGTSSKKFDTMHILSYLRCLDVNLANKEPSFKGYNSFSSLPFNDFIIEVAKDLYQYDMERIFSLLCLKKSELLSDGKEADQDFVVSVHEQQARIMKLLTSRNNFHLIMQSRLAMIKAWAQLVNVILDTLTGDSKLLSTLIFEVISGILPCFSDFASKEVSVVEELMSLCVLLIAKLKDSWATGIKFKNGDRDFTTNRIRMLYITTLQACQSPQSTSRLRSYIYVIAHTFLSFAGETERNMASSTIRRDRLMEVVFNDAVHSDGQCKIMATLLLDSMVSSAPAESQLHLLNAMQRQNFIFVLLESLKDMDADLVAAAETTESITFEVTSFQVKCGLLLRLAQTRTGASYILSAGLFRVLHNCKLLLIDPELGPVYDLPPDSGGIFYQLLHSVLRLVGSCLLSLGDQNMPLLEATNAFVESIKSTLVVVLKNHSLRRFTDKGAEQELADIADLIVLIFSICHRVDN